MTEHPGFGKVRTREAGGRVWFCARDVASALGYANPKDAVNQHCGPKGVCVHDLLTAGSRLPSVERFESWIFDELVPRTLKEGGYLLGKENALDTLKLNLRAPKVHYFDRMLRSSSTHTATLIAKEPGMSGRELNLAAYRTLSEGRIYTDPYARLAEPLRGNRHGHAYGVDREGPSVHPPPLQRPVSLLTLRRWRQQKKGCSPLFWRTALEISVPDLFYLSRHVYRMARSPDGAVVPPDHFPHRPQDILARATYIGKAEAQPAVTEIRLYAPGIPDISHIIHFVSADLPCLHPRLVIFALMLHVGFPQAGFRVRSRVGLPASYAMFHNLHIQFF